VVAEREFVMTFLRISHLQQAQQAERIFNLLTKAINTHARLTREAATGRGIDRHLLGLQLMLNSNEHPPSLFTDSLFSESQQWKLSTSGLSAGHWFNGTGFGAAYKDGYGINCGFLFMCSYPRLMRYNVSDLAAPEMIKFGIECKFSSFETSTNTFKTAITNALRDMKKLCLIVLALSENTLIKSHL